jgi:hypothetical protein
MSEAGTDVDKVGHVIAVATFRDRSDDVTQSCDFVLLFRFHMFPEHVFKTFVLSGSL